MKSFNSLLRREAKRDPNTLFNVLTDSQLKQIHGGDGESNDLEGIVRK